MCVEPAWRRRGARGFSLLELAITLAIVGMLAGALMVPMMNQIASRNIAITDRALTDIKDALLGFAAANGRLPCPATETSKGFESFAANGTVNNGICASFYGFVPAVTLGVTPIDSNGYAIDGWGGSSWNRIRYAVSNKTVGTVANPFTSANGIRNATINAVAGATLFYVCASGVGVNAAADCGSAQTLTSNAPIVVWSVGANALTGGIGIDEAQNPHPNPNTNPQTPYGTADVIFVSHTISDSLLNPFDDMVTWLGVSTLVNKMLAAGTLP